MTPRETLLALAARCEAAQGPDRRLDAEIAAALRIGSDLPEWAQKWGGEWRAAPSLGIVVLVQADGSNGPHFRSLLFTASLDAALTLVPDGWAWKVGVPLAGPGKPWAHVFGWPAQEQSEHGNCATPALALCAAALRARAEAADAS